MFPVSEAKRKFAPHGALAHAPGRTNSVETGLATVPVGNLPGMVIVYGSVIVLNYLTPQQEKFGNNGVTQTPFPFVPSPPPFIVRANEIFRGSNFCFARRPRCFLFRREQRREPVALRSDAGRFR